MKNEEAVRGATPDENVIRIRGARQNNLKSVDLDIPVGSFTVVTGLSGSGKSSLVFDTLYAEGQRRYVETFSPYARQFLDRMNRPKADAVEGVPPAIAIDQEGAIRTSRSTVGTMTELNDHLKLLFGHHAQLFCPHCGIPVPEHTPETILQDAMARLPEPDARIQWAFELRVPKTLPIETAENGLSAQGFTRIIARRKTKDGTILTVSADRFRADAVEVSRARQAVSTALEKGSGEALLFVRNDEGEDELLARYREGRVCPTCGRTFSAPTPNKFSFNSPVAACTLCRGFGRVIQTDMKLVIPDESLSLAAGAVRPWRSGTQRVCQEDLIRCAKNEGIRTDVPWRDLTDWERRWVTDGSPLWKGDWKREWYGIRRYFEWLETKNYKMHVRVLLARYRSYDGCPACGGARLLPESLAWRYGTKEARETLIKSLPEASRGALRFVPQGTDMPAEAYDALPGFNIHELMSAPVGSLRRFFEGRLANTRDESEAMVLREVVARIGFLTDVGLGYLTLDRQGRTLSGGEVERVNLTTALGTNLVNTLFVIDEPSIGLHPRDMDRVNGVLRRLVAAGNTAVVVEHDPQVMLAGERIVDLGPGPGAAGGRVLFNGTTREMLAGTTLTAEYLSGRRIISRERTPGLDEAPVLTLEHVTMHNLRDLRVDFPLKGLTAVAGVSGSGKSTLIADVLVPALTGEAPSGVVTGTRPDDVIFVDQSPMGRTARGNPVSYVGAYGDLRDALAAEAERTGAPFKAVDFSFNAGKGRCPHCLGSGYEQIEMQFLSDVLLPCPECGGKRFIPEVLNVRIPTADGRRLNIAEILDLTVDEAAEAFADIKGFAPKLTHLREVGLGYLTLGQPLPTLSGGERQRLKLAAHLAESLGNRRRPKTKLFVFDEPTTGLHFADVERLVGVFDKLIKAGHAVLVIEHNLDVLDCADHVIEMGPGGGDEGGQVVFTGTPDQMCDAATLTGTALAAWRRARAGDATRESFFNLPPLEKKREPFRVPAIPTRAMGRSMQSLLLEKRAIAVEGAREHNLKNLTAAIPHNALTVVTGPSGSGKSTLAFNIVFAEGQRRYLSSLNAYARSMVQPPPVPDVDAVREIPPTVAIEQRTSRGGMRSTVATMTELHHFLRLIYAKLGTQYCPDCNVPVEAQPPQAIAQSIRETFGDAASVRLLVPLVRHQKAPARKEMEALQASGIKELLIDGEWVSIEKKVPALKRAVEHNIDWPIAEVDPKGDIHGKVEEALVASRFQSLTVWDPATGRSHYYSAANACPECARSFPELDPRLFSYNANVGVCPTCMGYGVVAKSIRDAIKKGEAFDRDMTPDPDEERTVCPDCNGARLNAVARAVRWKGEGIHECEARTVDETAERLKALRLTEREEAIGRDALAEIRSRIGFLQRVGLGYLTLDRSAPTLSGGEAQRIRLASQLGTALRGACYILDEPTIGLHPRDNAMLLDAMGELARLGNTLLVVEHDEETIRHADCVIDIGPGAGVRGGELRAMGTVEEISANPDSVTGRALAEPLTHTGEGRHPVEADTPKLVLRNVRMHNLALDKVEIPLGRLTALTGVSGSGKSTLAREVLFRNLTEALHAKPGQTPAWSHTDGIEGVEKIRRALEVDQTPIGKTRRSCPATYVGFYQAIRDLFAQSPDAQERGFGPGRFTFNRTEGACPDCAGMGFRTVEMAFLPDVQVPCETCRGARFNPETLAVRWKGKTIGDVLNMSVDDALVFFESMPTVARPLQLLQDVGLGYLTLGQPSPTLSGGEAQRIKLVYELSKIRGASSPHTLYVLDEPTVGLHMTDVAKLIEVLERLVEAGHTVLVIEHDLDMVASADHVIDLGPEGGAGGGRIVGEGTPKALSKKATHTGRALKAFLAHRKPKKTSAKDAKASKAK